MTRFPWLAPAAAAIVLGVAGCGGGEEKPLVIKLDLDRVASGSRIGDSAFCRGGTTLTRYDDDTTVTKLRCRDGELTIASPSGVRRGCWYVLRATGSLEGLSGRGEMQARSGRATFAGTVVV